MMIYKDRAIINAFIKSKNNVKIFKSIEIATYI